MRKRLWWSTCLLVLAYLGAAAAMDRHKAMDRHNSNPHRSRSSAIVVLGCRVRPDGRPSPALARRARLGAELWQQGLAPRLVLTGGVGDFEPSEAEAAARIARRMGVPDSAIILEDRSTSTEETARETARLIEADSVLIVTDSYHTFRAQRVFRRYFSQVEVVGSMGSPSVRIRGALREVVAVSLYAILGRL